MFSDSKCSFSRAHCFNASMFLYKKKPEQNASKIGCVKVVVRVFPVCCRKRVMGGNVRRVNIGWNGCKILDRKF